MTKELDLVPAEGSDIIDCQCPVCDQEFTDNCAPDCEEQDRIKCPQCGKWLTIVCEVSIERTYNMEIDDNQQED